MVVIMVILVMVMMEVLVLMINMFWQLAVTHISVWRVWWQRRSWSHAKACTEVPSPWCRDASLHGTWLQIRKMKDRNCEPQHLIFFFRRLKCFVCWAATLAMSTMCSIALTAQTVKMHQWWGSNSIIIFYCCNAEVPLIKWLICRRNFSRHVDVKHSGIFRAEASFLLCQACGSPMRCQCQAEAATLPSPVMKQRLLRFLGWEVVMLADKGRKL